jgi:hypothetical protein
MLSRVGQGLWRGVIPVADSNMWAVNDYALRDLLVHLVRKYRIDEVYDSKVKAQNWEKLIQVATSCFPFFDWVSFFVKDNILKVLKTVINSSCKKYFTYTDNKTEVDKKCPNFVKKCPNFVKNVRISSKNVRISFLKMSQFRQKQFEIFLMSKFHQKSQNFFF